MHATAVSTTDKGKEINQKNRDKFKLFWESVFEKVPSKDIYEMVRVWNEVMDIMDVLLKNDK